MLVGTPPVKVLLDGNEAMVQVGINPITVTVAAQVFTFPFTSVTVSVTAFAPILAQPKVDLLTARLWTPQLSKLALSISAGTIEAEPTELSVTVWFLQSAVGKMLSSTVTTEVHCEVLPLLSVTVRVTVLSPTLSHGNVVTFAVRSAIPQASLLPLLIMLAVTKDIPLAFN
jgi:hypothetical protein